MKTSPPWSPQTTATLASAHLLALVSTPGGLRLLNGRSHRLRDPSCQMFCVSRPQPLMTFPWHRRLSLHLCPQVSTTASSGPEDPETLPLGGADPSGEDPPTGSAGLASPVCVCLCERVSCFRLMDLFFCISKYFLSYFKCQTYV